MRIFSSQSVKQKRMTSNDSDQAKKLNKSDTNVDMRNVARDVWLVKVPKYISEKWNNAPGNIEVGKLRIKKFANKRSEITMDLSQAVLAMKKPNEKDIPKHHKASATGMKNQKLGVFAEVGESSDVILEGNVVTKLDFRPTGDNVYMNFKLESIKKAYLPRRKVEQLTRAVTKFKPVSDHKFNIEYAKKKKAKGLRVRREKDAVMDILFEAFEKHQYYTLKDLVVITNQPELFLREILREICVFNVKPPHKNRWELRPEYRHYEEKSKESN